MISFMISVVPPKLIGTSACSHWPAEPPEPIGRTPGGALTLAQTPACDSPAPWCGGSAPSRIRRSSRVPAGRTGGWMPPLRSASA